MLDFKDKVVLITGAAQGFGRVLANAFAEALVNEGVLRP
jgi:NAD(P)-dependent dehydrogenase (short-subunit alcohol dehydrogenase family)